MRGVGLGTDPSLTLVRSEVEWIRMTIWEIPANTCRNDGVRLDARLLMSGITEPCGGDDGEYGSFLAISPARASDQDKNPHVVFS